MKSYLKWAGGKSRLVSAIRSRLPAATTLIEPFCGSASVFLGLTDRYPSAVLADANPDLIACHRFVRDEGLAFVDFCAELWAEENLSQAAYLAHRARFNALVPGDRERARLFVYINRFGYNGLCRYAKRSGKLNVPHGKLEALPYFPREEMLDFAKATQHVDFQVADFRAVMAVAQPGSVIYLDPPYAPRDEQVSNFSEYSPGGSFTDQDQRDLAELALECSLRGVPVLVSNHLTPFTTELYRHATRIDPIQVTRSISRDGAGRGKVGELLALYAADVIELPMAA